MISFFIVSLLVILLLLLIVMILIMLLLFILLSLFIILLLIVPLLIISLFRALFIDGIIARLLYVIARGAWSWLMVIAHDSLHES